MNTNTDFQTIDEYYAILFDEVLPDIFSDADKLKKFQKAYENINSRKEVEEELKILGILSKYRKSYQNFNVYLLLTSINLKEDCNNSWISNYINENYGDAPIGIKQEIFGFTQADWETHSNSKLESKRIVSKILENTNIFPILYIAFRRKEEFAQNGS
jgi:hypothetical protein